MMILVRRIRQSVLILGFIAASATAAESAPIKWKIAGAFPSQYPELGSQGVAAAKRVNAASQGRLRFTYFGPGKLTPPGRYLDPVRIGAIDGAWSAPNLLTRHTPVFGLLGGPPFGLAAPEHMAWLQGPGLGLYRATYETLGLTALPCGIISGQAFAWTTEPLAGAGGLKGLRIGVAQGGLNVAALQAAGLTVRVSSPARLHVMALGGGLEALALGPYSADMRLRTQQVAGHGLAPNPLAPAYVMDLIFSHTKWRSLERQDQQAIQAACRANIADALGRQAANAPGDIAALRGVAKTFGPLPADARTALNDAWNVAAKRIAAANKPFAAAMAQYPWPNQ